MPGTTQRRIGAAYGRKTPASAGVFLRASLLAGTMALLAACATPQTDSLRAAPPAPLRQALTLSQVPFFPQADYQCGPASLAMVLAHGGLAVDADLLTPQVYIPGRAGSLQPEMLATARRHGRLAVTLPPRLDAVLQEVAAGRPVIVLQNLSLPVAPVWHYAVVIGFDLAHGSIVLHSGPNASQRMPLPVFERTWARSGHWAMTATPPDDPPRSPGPDALVGAAAALERVDPAAAHKTYRVLTRTDPQVFGAWLGLGNSALSLQDFPTAAAALGHAVHLRPDSADGWNNLALARLRLNDLGGARQAAEKALALGGPRSARYRDTLAAVLAAEPAALPR